MKKIEKAQNKKKANELIVKHDDTIVDNYRHELDTNPQYSLLADPEDKFGMSDIQKQFIEHYVNFKNINTAAELTGIDMDTAKQLFVDYGTQSEIRRINKALYQRQFSNKLLNIDEIGGYLTSLLTGDNVPLADQLKTNEKLRVVDLIIKLNEMKANALINPETLMTKDINVQIKQLSVETIMELLNQSNKQENEEIIQSLDDNVTIEEKAYLSSLPTEDLLDLIEDTNNGGN